jgi:drug/metabolite transporter (DMT)-like permease
MCLVCVKIKTKIMTTRLFGFIVIIVGIIMMAYTGFNYVTTKKVVDLGAIQIDKKENHYFDWSPIVGIVLVFGGVVAIAMSAKNKSKMNS